MKIILNNRTTHEISNFSESNILIPVEKEGLIELMDVMTIENLSSFTIADGDCIRGTYVNKQVKSMTYDGEVANFLLIDVDVILKKVRELEFENEDLKVQLQQTQEAIDFLLMQ